MPVPSATELLSRLDKTNHPERLRFLGELGRNHAGDYQLAAVISELATGDTFARQVGLRLAVAARDQFQVLHALGENAVSVMSIAAGAAPRLVTDPEALLQVFQGATPMAQKLLLRGIRRYKRCDIAEHLFPYLYKTGNDRAAAALLTLCSAEVVTRHLPRLSHLVCDQARMAQRHPIPVLHWLTQEMEKAPSTHTSVLLKRYLPAFRVLAVSEPGPLLNLLTLVMPETNLPEAASELLGALVRRQPGGVLRLLELPGPRRTLSTAGLPNGIRRNLNLFQGGELARLARLLSENPIALADLLTARPVEQRADLFYHATKDLDTGGIAWPSALLAALPHEVRRREVTRMLSLRIIREDRFRLMEVTAHADRQTALPVILEAARAAAAEERALGYALLIRNAAVNRDGLHEMLQYLLQLENEQEPVRGKALSALAAVPPLQFQADHLESLDRIFKITAAPQDTSYRIRAELTSLAGKMLIHYAHNPWEPRFRFALDALVDLARSTGNLTWHGLEQVPALASPHVYERFEPLLEEQIEAENFHTLFAVTRMMRRHLPRLERLQALLARVVLMGNGSARQAAELWLKPGHTRDTRVTELLAWDESAVELPTVFRHLHRKRQILLEPFLRGKEIQGRFRRRKGVFRLPVTNGFQRWLPRQQRIYARFLDTVIYNPSASAHQRNAAVHTKAALPLIRAREMGRLTESGDPVLIEASLRALSHVDRVDESLPILMEHLQGDNARIAMYAIPRCTRFLNRNRLTAILDQLLRRDPLKVTVRKEALRLLGSIPSLETLALLEREAVRPDNGRDIRIALGHAARSLAGMEGAWPLLERLASDPDPQVVRSLTLSSGKNMAAPQRTRYARLLLSLVDHEDTAVRRGVLYALRRFAGGLSEEVVPVLAKRVAVLNNTPEWDQTLDTLIFFLSGEGIIRPFVDAVRSLVRKPLIDEYNAREERDVPARQRLARLCRRLVSLDWEDRRALASLLHEVAGELDEDPTLAHESVRLQLAAADPRDIDTFTATLLSIADACAVRPTLYYPAESLLVRLLRETPTDLPDRFLALFDALAGDENAWSTRLATVILRCFGPRTRWSRPFAQRLRYLRNHGDPDVRATALDIHTADEALPATQLDPGFRLVS
ncbi:MAG: hypothetical protein QNK37_37430 [Acidobacteriota bacterium]|nr:hypothetical protein [Acidobacteriota bacterium]